MVVDQETQRPHLLQFSMTESLISPDLLLAAISLKVEESSFKFEKPGFILHSGFYM